jgi:type VI secretion system protein VasI
MVVIVVGAGFWFIAFLGSIFGPTATNLTKGADSAKAADTTPPALPEQATPEPLNCRTQLPDRAFATFQGQTQKTPPVANLVFRKTRPSIDEAGRLLRACMAAAVAQNSPRADLQAWAWFTASGAEQDENMISFPDGSDYLVYSLTSRHIITAKERAKEPKGSTPAVSAPPLPTPKGPDKWLSEAGTSKMDGSPSVAFEVRAEGPIQGWLSVTVPTLDIRCQEQKTELYVGTGTNAQPKYGTIDEVSVEVRFDNGAVSRQTWDDSTDHKALFAREPIAVARQVAAAKRMFVRFTPFNANPQVIEFDVRGFDQHVGAVGQVCGWK